VRSSAIRTGSKPKSRAFLQEVATDGDREGEGEDGPHFNATRCRISPLGSGATATAPQVDATRRHLLSIGRRRFLSLRSLRGLLPLAQFPTTIRIVVRDSQKKFSPTIQINLMSSRRFSAYSPHAPLTVGAIHSSTFF